MLIDLKSCLCPARNHSLYGTAIIMILMVLSAECPGQSTLYRPKVGLALSGGAACGIAHVGVLKVLEESGIRPDYITGVSMGSIIGGMYALGYSADSIGSLLRDADWDKILSGRIPESRVVFPEKKRYMNSIISLPLTLKKVALPSGLINGQQIENMLSYYAWPALDINDFSSLPIPFECVATDIINNKKVILDRGYLPDAIRASIAVPSLITPIRIDSLLLIDGGFIRNFAADELREMGADIIIGSYTGYRQHTAEEVETVSDVIRQIGLIGSLQDYQEQKKLVDFLIEPDIKGFSVTGFYASDTLVRRGYRAASRYRNEFRDLADSLNNIAPGREPGKILADKTYIFDRVIINGNKIHSDDQILGVLDINRGESVSRDFLTNRIDLLYGKSWFEKVKYRFIKTSDSLILAIDCEEKPRTILYGSVHYDNALRAGMIIGLSVKNPFLKRSQLEINSFIGDNYRFSLEYIKYADRNEKYSLTPFIYTDQTYIPSVTLFDKKISVDSRNLLYGLSLKRRLGLNHMITLTGQLENLTLDYSNPSDPVKEKLRSNYCSAELLYNINTLDNKHFPDRGTVSFLNLRASKLISARYFADEAETLYGQNETVPYDSKVFFTFRYSINHYFPGPEKLTVSTGADFLYVSKTDSVSSQNNCYYAGGIEPLCHRTIPLTGFHPLQLQVTGLACLRLDIDYELLKNLHLNMMTTVAFANNKPGSNTYSFLGGIGAGAGYLSVIGPVRAGLMYDLSRKYYHPGALKGFISIGFCF